ncbi:MAG: hypothetical protein LBB82_02295, partial [Treponema sp.]|nr:hypothetical protein [Treponema sp.]
MTKPSPGVMLRPVGGSLMQRLMILLDRRQKPAAPSVPPGAQGGFSRFLTAFLLIAACAGSPAAAFAQAPAGAALSLDQAIAVSAADIAGKLPAGTRVAVVAFESPHLNLSDYIMREVTGVLVDGRLEVADRNNLPYVYQELNYQMSGAVSDESAIGIGKFLG